MLPLVLASSSPYRRALLERLQLPFEHAAPNINESPQSNESPHELVIRLAENKARALSPHFSQHLIIGSDQVAINTGQILGKPHTFERAKEQLLAASGRSVSFITGIALYNSLTDEIQSDAITFTVHFRSLTEKQISRYLHAEQPYDCAGSFKAEGLGISLFRATEGEDTTSLIGLPLIRLISMLEQQGYAIP